MTVTAPIDVSSQQGTIARDGLAQDDIVIVDQAPAVQADPQAVVSEISVPRDPAMLFVYLGVLSLVAIIAISAILAL